MNYHIFDSEIKKPQTYSMQQDDFWRPKMSNESIPINNKHENYIFDKNANLFYEQQKQHQNQFLNQQHQFIQPINTRIDSSCYKPSSYNQENINSSYNQQNYSKVQKNIQDKQISNNIMNNFETLNGHQEINHYLERNPVNSRRDQMEKIRNNDRYQFLEKQGGNLHNFADFQTTNTRKVRNDINTSNYIPMGKTMAIPKENI